MNGVAETQQTGHTTTQGLDQRPKTEVVLPKRRTGEAQMRGNPGGELDPAVLTSRRLIVRYSPRSLQVVGRKRQIRWGLRPSGRPPPQLSGTRSTFILVSLIERCLEFKI